MEVVLVDKKETRFKATDGTLFNSEVDCKKYEGTLKCIIQSRYNKLVVKETNACDLFYFGNEEDYIDIVFIKDEKDKEAVVQQDFLQFDKMTDYTGKRADEICSKLVVGEYNLISRGYESAQAYPLGTFESFVADLRKYYDRLMSNVKKEGEE